MDYVYERDGDHPSHNTEEQVDDIDHVINVQQPATSKVSKIIIRQKPNNGFMPQTSAFSQITHNMLSASGTPTQTVPNTMSDVIGENTIPVVEYPPDIWYPSDQDGTVGSNSLRTLTQLEKTRQNSTITMLYHYSDFEKHLTVEQVLEFRDDDLKPMSPPLQELLLRENKLFFKRNSYVLGNIPCTELVANMARIFIKWYTTSLSNRLSSFSSNSSRFTYPINWSFKTGNPIYSSFVAHALDQSFSGETLAQIVSAVVTYMKRLTLYLLTDVKWYKHDQFIVAMMKRTGNDNISDFMSATYKSKEVSELRLFLMTLNACKIPHLIVPLKYESWTIQSLDESLKHNLNGLKLLHDLINYPIQSDIFSVVVIKTNDSGYNTFEKFVLLDLSSKIQVKISFYDESSDLNLLHQYIYLACLADNKITVAKFNSTLSHRQRPLPPLISAYTNHLSVHASKNNITQCVIELNDDVINDLIVQLVGNRQLRIVPGRTYEGVSDYHNNLECNHMLETLSNIEILTIVEFMNLYSNVHTNEDEIIMSLYLQKEFNKLNILHEDNISMSTSSQHHELVTHVTDKVEQSTNLKPLVVVKKYNDNSYHNQDVSKHGKQLIVEKRNKNTASTSNKPIIVEKSQRNRMRDTYESDNSDDSDIQEHVDSVVFDHVVILPTTQTQSVKRNIPNEVITKYPFPLQSDNVYTQNSKLVNIIKAMIIEIANLCDDSVDNITHKICLEKRLKLAQDFKEQCDKELKSKSDGSKVTTDIAIVDPKYILTSDMGVCNWSLLAYPHVVNRFDLDFIRVKSDVDAYNEVGNFRKRNAACRLIRSMIPLAFAGRLNNAKFLAFTCPVELIDYTVEHLKSQEELIMVNRTMNCCDGPQPYGCPSDWLHKIRNAIHIVGQIPKELMLWLTLKSVLSPKILACISTNLHDKSPGDFDAMCDEIRKAYSQSAFGTKLLKESTSSSSSSSNTSSNVSTSSSKVNAKLKQKTNENTKTKDAPKKDNNHFGTNCMKSDNCTSTQCFRSHPRDNGIDPKKNETQQSNTSSTDQTQPKKKPKLNTPAVN